MTYDDFYVQYQGFHPSDFTKDFIESILNELKLESPRGAILKASFVKKRDHFKGVVKIQTSVGPFFASATNSSLKEVSERITGQLRRRIQKWKTKKTKEIKYENASAIF